MKNRVISTDLLILILTVASAAFAIAAAIVNPAAAGIVAAGLLVVLFVLGSNAKATRKIVKSIFYGSGKHSNLQQLSFEKLNIPVAIISKDTIVWYNDSFREKLLGGNDSDRTFPHSGHSNQNNIFSCLHTNCCSFSVTVQPSDIPDPARYAHPLS